MKTSPLTLAVAAGLLGMSTLAVQAVHADDRPDHEIEIVAMDQHLLSYESLVRDTDGDGWTDWTERLEGTDPNDPKSHPQELRVDLLDGSVYVQSSTFPDRFVVIDLATLPIEKTTFEALADVVGQITGQTSLGKFVSEMRSSELGGRWSDQLDGILAEASTMTSKDDGTLGARTGGVLVSLIASGIPGMQGAKDNSFVQFSSDGGDIKITVTMTDMDSSGTGNAYVKEYVNGSLTSSSIISYKNGVAVFGTTTDASGKQTDAAVVPLSSAPPATSAPAPATSAPASSAPASSAPATSAPASSAPATSAPASSEPATTEKGDYTNPDADQYVVVVTAADVRARVAFLRGVNGNYRSTIELPKDWSPTKSGVADPAEPDCEQSGCVAFTVFMTTTPDTSTAGACPTTYCTPGRP